MSSPDHPALTPPLPLPHARHARRLPPHVTADQVQRLRAAAYNLPQVVKPADFIPEGSPGFEEHLDQMGLVLLQRAAGGARPSRWIAPDDVDAALNHLAVVGNASPVRALMTQRTGQLDTLGLVRNSRGWERRVRQALPLQRRDAATARAVEPPMTVTYLVPVDKAVIWDFYRSGDLAELQQRLGPPPGHAQAAELMAHLQGLLDRSALSYPQHLDALIPRLQLELSRPQEVAELLAACNRTQDRWTQHAIELETLAGLNHELAFQGYPDTFATARALQRSVTLFVGPPNSGKTHQAFERLAQAHNGAYLAPLRLLALEGRDRLVGRGVPCSLLTGEENVAVPGAALVSSTIEMVDTNRAIDVAVIDEAQMVFDDSRGWAWTQAIVGVPANEVIIICSAYAVPAIEQLLALCGERCTLRHFERKQHVQLLPAPVPLNALQLGDAVVAFSRRDVLMLRDQIAADGHSVSVIYGALPPEVRRREAERFAHGHAHVLVATDAIGMGLNLPIRRVLFSTLSKFDGTGDRPLSESEVHQIAGRAGRYGMHEEGFTGVLREAEPGAAKLLKELLPRHPVAPPDFKAPVAPNWWHVSTIAQRLGLQRLGAVLAVFVQQLKLDDAHFAVAELAQMQALAEQLDQSASALPLKQRFTYAQAPVDSRAENQVQEFLNWTAQHALTGQAGSPWFLDAVDEHSRLDRMEQALRACTLWLWLDLRFPNVYGHLDEVINLRNRLNDGIERQLKGLKPLAQLRSRARR